MTRKDEKLTAFTKIQRIVAKNIDGSSIKEQLVENKYLTALYLSQLAYFKFSTISEKMSEYGAKRLSLYDHDNIQGYFAEFNDLAIVSWRGTQLSESKDLKDGFTFWKTWFGKHRVHCGYGRSLTPLLSRVEDDLSRVHENKHLIYVGHSMGGALATLLALHHKPAEICTFGAPHVVGPELADQLSGIEYNRIITSGDWITLLPPSLPFLRYKHPGTKYVLPIKWRWADIIYPHKLPTYLNALLSDKSIVSVEDLKKADTP